jgi:2-polyprenyl-3-methyl-5-hydroxy-6-metoxy-1,4-benzoquinol methylase
MTLYRPKPIVPKNPISLTKKMEIQRVLEHLLEEQHLILWDDIQTGINILKSLQEKGNNSVKTYKERQNQKNKFHKLAKNILVLIKKNKVQLQENTSTPVLLSLLFTEATQPIYLSLLDFQDLHQASKRYEEGILFSVLGHKLHPFFAVYTPTRTSHLELFATWLHKYSGQKECAYDIGVGCGILSFLLAKSAFKKIIATDNNPNAIESVRRDIEKLKTERNYLKNNIFGFCGDLFAEQNELADVIVCNPPWMLGETKTKLDQAMFFEKGFFERFFEQAHMRLRDNGVLVMIFSNIIDLVTPEVGHPIQRELQNQRFALVQKMQRKLKPNRNDRKNRRTKEKVEVWELKKRTGYIFTQKT